MPTREEIERTDLHHESVERHASETNRDYELFDTVPLVAIAVVTAYFLLVFAFVTLGG